MKKRKESYTEQDWDSDVHRRLSARPAGAITYPKSWPKELIEQLGYFRADTTNVFTALKRLEEANKINRTVKVVRERERMGMTTYPASRQVTIIAL